MPALLHALLMTISAGLAYFWLQNPSLEPYSLQAFAGMVLIYFMIKRISKAKFWHVLPAFLSVETIFATFAFLLLIGSTGGLSSIFFALAYVHLFFIVFSSTPDTSIYMTMVLVLFYYALSPDLTSQNIATLFSLPVIMFFFLFAKKQYEEALRERSIIKADEKEIEAYRKELSLVDKFLTEFLQPKVDQLTTLLQFPKENQAALKKQLKLIKTEAEKLMTLIEIKKKS